MPETPQTGVLFVCLGNICRSPLAEGVFIHLARERDELDRFRVDSCGTGNWHVGSRPDRRALAIAKRHGVELPSRARQLRAPHDFDEFDWIIPMDRANLSDILDAGGPEERTRLLRSFDPRLAKARSADLDVPDPYYGGDDGFGTVFTMVRDACEGLLDHLAR